MPVVPEGHLRAGGPPGQWVGSHLVGPTWGGPLLLVLLVTASCAVCTSTPEVCPQLMYVAGNSYYPHVMGLYILQSEPHENKPYYSHACHEAYIYYHPKHDAWWVGPVLGAPSGHAILEGDMLTSAGGGGGGSLWRYWSQPERRWFYDTGVKLICLNISCQRFAMSSQHLPAFVSEEFHLGDVIYYDRPVYVNSASGVYLYHSHRSRDCHVWQISAHVGDEQGYMYIRSSARNPLDVAGNWNLSRTEDPEEGGTDSEESLNITITCLEYYQYYNNDSFQVSTPVSSTTLTVGRDVTEGTTSQTDVTSQTESSSPTDSTESGPIYTDIPAVTTTSINSNMDASTSTTYNMGTGGGRMEEEDSTVSRTGSAVLTSDPEVMTTTASSKDVVTGSSTLGTMGVSTVGGDVTSSLPTGSDVQDVLTTPSGKATSDSSLFISDITTVLKSIDEQLTTLPTTAITNVVTETNEEDVTTGGEIKTRLPDVTESSGSTSRVDVTTSSNYDLKDVTSSSRTIPPVGEGVTSPPDGGDLSTQEQLYGSSNEPVVSTTSSLVVTSEGGSEVTTPPGSPRTTPSGLPAVCGQRIIQHAAASFLISGTASAYQGKWSWMVAILRADNRTKCGAALVADRYLVTAAHCIDGSNTTVASYRVMLGANNRDVSEQGIVFRSIRRVILHTNFTYSKSPFRIGQDVGLVELDSPVTFSNYIQPLCLPEASDLAIPFLGVSSNFTSCYMTGFGYMHVDSTGTKTSSGGVLQEQSVRLSPISSCARRYYGRYPWLSSSDNLCAHPNNYAKLCSGDSGSPLMCRQGSQWTLVGVASWAFAACIGSNYPSIYVDIRLHADWLRQQIANGQSATSSQTP